MPDATATTAAAGATPAAGGTDPAGATPAAPAAPAAAQAGSAGATPAAAATATTQAAPNQQQLGESGLAALEAERRRSGDLEKQLNAAKKELDGFRTAQMSELEKAQAKAAEFERQLADATRQNQEQRVRVATVTAAQKAGFADPEDALRLIDRAAIEFDEQGDPKNIAKLAGDLLKAKPYLATGAGKPAGSQDFGTGGQPAPRIEDVAKGMTADQFANWLQANPQYAGIRR